jgi:hypothetical protein
MENKVLSGILKSNEIRHCEALRSNLTLKYQYLRSGKTASFLAVTNKYVR